MTLTKYLKFLGISFNASPREIKMAYKKLYKKYHSDRGLLRNAKRIRGDRFTLYTSPHHPTFSSAICKTAIWGVYPARKAFTTDFGVRTANLSASGKGIPLS